MKPLSPNNILNALVFPTLLAFMLPLFIVSGSVKWISSPALAIILYTLLFTWIYFSAKQTYDLHYDLEFLYLNSIGKSSKVPMSSIKSIQRSNEGIRVKGLTSWKYTIEFHSDITIVSQCIYETVGSKKVEEFAEIVKQKNATVIIRLV